MTGNLLLDHAGNGGSELVGDDDTTINAAAGSFTIDAQFSGRAMRVKSGCTVQIVGVTFRDAYADRFYTSSDGGAISNQGALSLTDSTVQGSNADGRGGGVFSKGTLTLLRSTISDNTADGVYSPGTLYSTI